MSKKKPRLVIKVLGCLGFFPGSSAAKFSIRSISKMFVRPNLDYGDVICHDQVKDSMAILEAIQYKAGLIVSGSWKGTNL